MPWEDNADYVRSGHRSPDDFQSDSMRTITISEEEGIKAVIGKLKGEDKTTVQSYLFDKSKGWTVEKAKAWFEKHQPVKEHVQAVLPFQVLEKIVDKPLRIRGVAMTAGMSRNFNIYTSEELQAFASKFVGSPVYIEHVSVENAIGKVTKTEWDGQALWYEAEIYESDVADKIRKGLVQHVSVGADYETLDVVDGKVPHGLHNAELSLVAVPGIPETNLQILEKLAREQVDPLVAGEYFLGFYQDPALFLPEHFRTVWLDQANGVLAVMAKVRADPAKESCQSILFLKSKWQANTVKDWLTIHPDYVSPASISASQNAPTGIEKMGKMKKMFSETLQQLKEQGLSKAEIEAKLNELSTERNALWQELEAIEQTIRQVSDAEREKNSARQSEINTKLDLLWAEISAYQEVLVNIISAGEEPLRKELGDANTKLTDTATKLGEAKNTIEQLRKQLPGGGLLVNPPKMMPISEAVGILEGLLPAPAVERSTMGMQRECQTIRSEILKLKERAEAK